jgi:outer membrane PBP1 activator LpoA protein
MLNGDAASKNHEAIWALIASLPADQLQPNTTDDLGGWMALALAVKSPAPWNSSKPRSTPGAHRTRSTRPLSTAIATDQAQGTGQPALNKIALLLPQDGPLASVGKALREGFMAAHYQAQQAGQKPPAIEFYDSSRLTSRRVLPQGPGRWRATGRRPTGKPLVKQLSTRPQLPITTLALNYSEGDQGPAQLFQFGLAAEDEAREVSRRARADGLHRAAIMVPKGEWGDRVLKPSARTGKPTAAASSPPNASTSQCNWPSKSPTCSSCVRAKVAPRACKAL